jgi:hypothetical protein
LGTSKQASDFELVSQFIINHIRKEYEDGNDVGDVLEDLKVFEAVQSSEPRGLDRRGAPAQAGPKRPTKDVETSDSGRRGSLTGRRETPIPSWHLSTKSTTLYTESYLLLRAATSKSEAKAVIMVDGDPQGAMN